ncbi:hypothetical protein KRZ98_05260 [Sphingobium sp. AS12]|uniref:hypothetical protein n=1 Tax=Sphingobium sp. AS12 TaxID=2849495 RepID=UPI001C315263|nr:hypothetical protein [Sphingobium sp. AS12]MBV2147694.1 hypothetical protein [Sphingobium sp. AS12]
MARACNDGVSINRKMAGQILCAWIPVHRQEYGTRRAILFEQVNWEMTMDQGACPFEEGDRVDHSAFGFGTVVGASGPYVGGDPRTGGIIPAGWRVKVKWDDNAKGETEISSGHLIKVSSPDQRPFAYWNRRWETLLSDWKKARRETEELASQFRPIPDIAQINEALSKEKWLWTEIEKWWSDEAAGRHS